jgi:RNA polymerase sigma factor (TIGR02999 family)
MEQPGSKDANVSSCGITALLRDWETGRPAALDDLFEAVYPELHRIAQRYCGRERISSTLQCTAAVNEAWLRLAQSQQLSPRDRTHFFAFSARLMRTILIDHARARKRKRRGGGETNFSLRDSDAEVPPSDVEILDLNSALEDLEKLDPMQGRIVELRYFSGLTIPETAEATGVSESTVKHEWIVAKRWIRRRLPEGKNEP